MRKDPIGSVEVILTTRVLDTSGNLITSVTEKVAESTGNPLWTTRVAHRCASEAADRSREMLQPRYGEIDKEWQK